MRIAVCVLISIIPLAAQLAPDEDVKFYNLEKEYRRTQTIIYELQNAQALELKPIVHDMLSIYGSLYVNGATNELYITDLPEKLQDLQEVLPYLDAQGISAGNNLVSQVVYLKHAHVSDLFDIIKHKLSPEGQVFEVPYLNALTITDIPSKIMEVRSLMAALDVPVKHIAVEITIVEFNNEDFSKLGLNLFNWLQGLSVSAEVHGDNLEDLWKSGSATIRSRGRPVIEDRSKTTDELIEENNIRDRSYHIRAGFAVSDIVNFICEKGDGSVLANTRLVTRNNKYAYLGSGEVIPYRHFDHGGRDEDAWESDRRTGIWVSVTPNVQEDSLINLRIRPSISDLTGWSPKGMPVIFNRELDTEVKVKDNAVFVLGGLKKRESVEVRRGIPGLKEIPVLQYFFSIKQKSIVEREVLIFIRPTTNVKTDLSERDFQRMMQEYESRTKAAD
ncbi:MAG: hypothetical protein GF398_09625 [Chitinivibrionales bacterium]|nr:hypothetical protein [Chitinivibrionales bacterium]